jgi:hypothetical protein
MLWDGIKRDRLVWAGDMHPEILSILSLFGEHRCVEESLIFARKEAPLPNFMNGIPSYSLWWLLIISDYYMHNKNLSFLEKEKKYITELIILIDSLIDNEGNLNFNFFFLDWPSSDSKEVKAGVYALCEYAIKKTKLIYSALGLELDILQRILLKLNKTLDGGCFKQIHAIKVLCGHSKADNIIHKLLDGGAKGLSTFMSYILMSIAKAGKTTEALDIMKEYYGAMLNLGATTFWEDFNIDWTANCNRIDNLPEIGQKDIHKDFGNYCYKGYRHSLCHGWSSGPVPFLMQNILGIKELEPGCRVIEIKPNLGNLKYAKGTYPTPYGLIEIEHINNNGKIISKITGPENVELIQK